LTLQVSEASIAAAARLPTDGEKWFKNQTITNAEINQFLKPEYQNPDWRKGIPRRWLKDEWDDLLKMVQKYITCEGRYTITLNVSHEIFVTFHKEKEE
jgi:hypothetical protein